MGNIEKVVSYMVGIANDDTHGYAQDNRYEPDFDCSSLLAKALIVGGFSVSRFSTTRNIPQQLLNLGWKEVSGKPKRGDVYCTRGKHCVLVVDEKTIVHASINENGKTTNGKTGDQTGKEICTRSFYTPSYGWEYHLRYEDKTTNNKPLKEIELKLTLTQIFKGCKGGDVPLAQTLLKLHGFSVGKSGVDGSFGGDTDEATKAFQKAKGLEVDGYIGFNTWSALLNI